MLFFEASLMHSSNFPPRLLRPSFHTLFCFPDRAVLLGCLLDCLGWVRLVKTAQRTQSHWRINNHASLLMHTCIDVRMEDTSYVGLHLFCSMSRHMLPSAYTVNSDTYIIGNDPWSAFIQFAYNYSRTIWVKHL